LIELNETVDMKIYVFQITLLFLMLLFSYYIVFQIDSGNLNYHQGKDGGISIQIESILIYSILAYCLCPIKPIIFRPLLGLLVALFVVICVYLQTSSTFQFQFISIFIVFLVSTLLTYLASKKN